MLTPEELKQKIEQTTLPEGITLFKEKVLKIALSRYSDPIYRQEMKEEYERINYDGSFFFFVEPNLGSSVGGVSDVIDEEQEKVALLLLLAEAYGRYIDVNTGIEDWLSFFLARTAFFYYFLHNVIRWSLFSLIGGIWLACGSEFLYEEGRDWIQEKWFLWKRRRKPIGRNDEST